MLEPADNAPKAAGAEPETRYVISGQPTGWAAMAKEVREFDEEKADNCKDDIDTLLVFAGLFSAVLSAFLIAAYPSLQPDPMAAMNYNLERIAAQTASYTLNSTTGTLVAMTILSSSLPPFQAAVNDVRVNILWFASLIVSLTTASFGMLVKQWLREFSAVDVPSPQARLRIRHFRAPQLKKWRVYEIAATLPLLLQLSLGLFFTGLCFFTASVHSSIGHTTIPLVVGWVVFFFGATLLPIFFPRCPYKTTLLKVPISRMHRFMSQLAEQLGPKWSAFVSRVETADSASRTAKQWIIAGTIGLLLQLAIYVQRALSSGFSWELRCMRLSHLRQAAIAVPSGFRWESWRMRLLHLPQALLAVMQKMPDELQLVNDVAHDIEILVSVDAIQANDELLGTTIAEALRHIGTDPADAVSFVFKLLGHRLPAMPDSEHTMPFWPFRGLNVFCGLRPKARNDILNILSYHVNKLHQEQEVCYLSLADVDLNVAARPVVGAFLTVISAAYTAGSVQLLPQGIIPFLQYYLNHPFSGPSLCRDALFVSTSSLGRMDACWDNAVHLLNTINTLATSMNLSFTAGICCFTSIQSELIRISSLVESHPSIPPAQPDWGRSWKWFDWSAWTWPEGAAKNFQGACLQYLFDLVSRELDRVAVQPLQDAETDDMLGMVLCAATRLLTQSTPYYWGDLLNPVVIKAFEHTVTLALESRSTQTTSALIDALLCCDELDDKTSKLRILRTLLYYRSLWRRGPIRPTAYQNNEDSLISVFCEKLSQQGDCSAILRLCYVAVLLLVHMHPSGRLRWRSLLSSFANSITSLIPASASASSSNYPHMAEGQATVECSVAAYACLYAMTFESPSAIYDLIERGISISYDKWQQHFSEDDTLFPDDLVNVLGQLCNKPEHLKLFRLRELQDRRLCTEEDRNLQQSTPNVENEHTGSAETDHILVDVGAAVQDGDTLTYPLDTKGPGTNIPDLARGNYMCK